MSTLPQIPREQRQRLRLTFGEPRFVRVGTEWMLIGPDTALPVGQQVQVFRFSRFRSEVVAVVVVGEHVYEHTVRRREGSHLHETGPSTVRYVIAKIAQRKRIT